jgi:hypothetical protein
MTTFVEVQQCRLMWCCLFTVHSLLNGALTPKMVQHQAWLYFDCHDGTLSFTMVLDQLRWNLSLTIVLNSWRWYSCTHNFSLKVTMEFQHSQWQFNFHNITLRASQWHFIQTTVLLHAWVNSLRTLLLNHPQLYFSGHDGTHLLTLVLQHTRCYLNMFLLHTH